MVTRRITPAHLHQTHGSLRQALRRLEESGPLEEEEIAEPVELTCEQLARLYRDNCRSKTKASKNGVIQDVQVCGLLREIKAVDLLLEGDYAGVDRLVFGYLRKE